MGEIKSSGVICKGNVKKNFTAMPDELFDYLELGLITDKDFTLYARLLKLFNTDYGYAFPTIDQLIVMNNTARSTLHSSLKRLEAVGLIEIGKGRNGNNVYLVFKPLDQEELYPQTPDKVKELNEKKVKHKINAENDKKRLNDYKQTKKEKEQELETNARTVEPQTVGGKRVVTQDEFFELTKDMKLEELKRFEGQIEIVG